MFPKDAFEMREECKKCRFFGITWFRTWFFDCSFFSNNETFFRITFSNFDTFYFLIWNSDASKKCLFEGKPFEEIRNWSNRSFSRTNVIQSVTFWMQTFLKFWHVFRRLIRNLTRCMSFFQNLTHCENMNSKFCL